MIDSLSPSLRMHNGRPVFEGMVVREQHGYFNCYPVYREISTLRRGIEAGKPYIEISANYMDDDASIAKLQYIGETLGIETELKCKSCTGEKQVEGIFRFYTGNMTQLVEALRKDERIPSQMYDFVCEQENVPDALARVLTSQVGRIMVDHSNEFGIKENVTPTRNQLLDLGEYLQHHAHEVAQAFICGAASNEPKSDGQKIAEALTVLLRRRNEYHPTLPRTHIEITEDIEKAHFETVKFHTRERMVLDDAFRIIGHKIRVQ